MPHSGVICTPRSHPHPHRHTRRRRRRHRLRIMDVKRGSVLCTLRVSYGIVPTKTSSANDDGPPK